MLELIVNSPTPPEKLVGLPSGNSFTLIVSFGVIRFLLICSGMNLLRKFLSIRKSISLVDTVTATPQKKSSTLRTAVFSRQVKSLHLLPLMLKQAVMVRFQAVQSSVRVLHAVLQITPKVPTIWASTAAVKLRLLVVLGHLLLSLISTLTGETALLQPVLLVMMLTRCWKWVLRI